MADARQQKQSGNFDKWRADRQRTSGANYGIGKGKITNGATMQQQTLNKRAVRHLRQTVTM